MSTKHAHVELIPLSERSSSMLVYRLAVALYLIGTTVVIDSDLPWSTVLGAVGGWVVVATLAHASWRVARQLGIRLWGGMLLLDGVFFAVAAWVAGQDRVAVWLLLVGHVVAVALMASYPTGLKLAVWHSLLAFSTFYASEFWKLQGPDGVRVQLGDSYFRSIVLLSVLLALTATSTAALSAMNERELRRRRYDLEALTQFATALESLREERDVATALVTAVRREFNLGRVVLLVRRKDSWVVADGQDDSPFDLPMRDFEDPSPLLTTCAGADRAMLVMDADPAQEQLLPLLFPTARRLMMVPLRAPQETVGVLVAAQGTTRSTRIERRVVDMVERFASHTAVTMQNVALLDAQRKLAQMDGLTGLPNRRSFDEALLRALSEPDGHGAVLLVDIDHFKRVNDVHGHLMGDDVLRGAAAAMAGQMRAHDVVARYGGEEFGAVLPGCPESTAWEVADRLREAVQDADLPVSVTCSIGVAAWPHDGLEPAALLQLADAALYNAKESGRNRVVSFAQMSRAVLERDALTDRGVQGLEGVPGAQTVSTRTP